MFDLHLENDAALAGFALLAQQEAGQDRFADALHQRRGGRQLVIGEVAQVGAQRIQITHLRQPEQHVQLVLEFVGRRAQRFGIATDASQLFGQRVDFTLVAEGGDGPDHPALVTNRRAVGEDGQAVEAELAIQLLAGAGQHFGQAAGGQILGDRPPQRRLAQPGADQQALRGRVDQGDARLIVDRQHALAHRGQHRLALFHQAGDFVGLQPQQHALDIARQQVRAEHGQQHQYEHADHHVAPMLAEQLTKGGQGHADRYRAEHVALCVQHRSKAADAGTQAAFSARTVGFAGQRRAFIVTAKGLADACRFRMGEAQGMPIHYHDEIDPQPLAQIVDIALQRVVGGEIHGHPDQRLAHVVTRRNALCDVGHPRGLAFFEGVLQLDVEQPERKAEGQHQHDGDQQRDQGVQAQAQGRSPVAERPL